MITMYAHMPERGAMAFVAMCMCAGSYPLYVFSLPTRWILSSTHVQRLAAAAYNDYVYVYSLSTGNWTQQTAAGSRTWTSVASSADGTVRGGSL